MISTLRSRFDASPRLRLWGPSVLVALLMTSWIVTHVDTGGHYPHSGEGPGLTLDETFNVQHGVLLVEALKTYGPTLLFPEPAREVFHPRQGLYLADHPPFGRLWLGLHHELTWWWHAPTDPEGRFVTACARTGSATAYGLTIVLVGRLAAGWYGWWAGMITALSYALLPRVFGHAHLAALETVTNLTTALAVTSVALWWPTDRPPSRWVAAGTGVLLGLAFLTKIQAIFIPPAIIAWALWRYQQRALWPLAIWGTVGLTVFTIGWPTMWFDFPFSLAGYFRGTTERVSLSVWFWGEHYTDRAVPRLYVWSVLFGTVPAKFMILFTLERYVSLRKGTFPVPALLWSPRESLLALAAAVPLLVFSLPGVPVYDMERLWLTIFPPVAILAGRSIAWLRHGAENFKGPFGKVAAHIMFYSALFPLVTLWRLAPFYLCSYTILCGSLANVTHEGGELDYWGTAISRSLQEQIVAVIPEGSTLAVAPVLHQFQVEELLRQSPVFRKHRLRLIAYDAARHPPLAADISPSPAEPSPATAANVRSLTQPNAATAAAASRTTGSTPHEPQYLLQFSRRADLPPERNPCPPQETVVVEVGVYGVPLAGLYRLQTAAVPLKP